MFRAGDQGDSGIISVDYWMVIWKNDTPRRTEVGIWLLYKNVSGVVTPVLHHHHRWVVVLVRVGVHQFTQTVHTVVVERDAVCVHAAGGGTLGS